MLKKSCLRINLHHLRKFTEKTNVTSGSMQQLDQKLSELKNHGFVKKFKKVIADASDNIVEHNKELFKELDQYKNTASNFVSSNSEKIVNSMKSVTSPVIKKITPTLKDFAESEAAKKLSKNIEKSDQKLLAESDAIKYGGLMPKAYRQIIKTNSYQFSNTTETGMVLREKSRWENFFELLKSFTSSILYQPHKNDGIIVSIIRETFGFLASPFSIFFYF